MQTVLKDVDKADLAMALKTASDAVKELILSSMSTRAAEMLNDDLENMGPVKVADVEGAQQKIIKVVKKLEEEGKLIMAGAGDDVVYQTPRTRGIDMRATKARFAKRGLWDGEDANWQAAWRGHYQAALPAHRLRPWPRRPSRTPAQCEPRGGGRRAVSQSHGSRRSI